MPKAIRISIPEITPYYSLIKTYFTGTGNEASISEGYFENQLDYFTSKPEFEDFTKLLRERGLLSDHNLYFFWVFYFKGADDTKYLENNKVFKIWNKRNKDLIKLKEVFSDYKLSYFPKYDKMLNSDERLFLKSISFELINSKGIPKTVSITAHPLMYAIFRYLEKFVQNEEVISKPKEKNVKTYLNNFILSTKPLYSYLKDTHFKNESNNNVYDFIGKFIKTVGIDLTQIYSDAVLPKEQIKSIYTKRGKSTS